MKRDSQRSTAVPSENEFDTMLAETNPELFVAYTASDEAVLQRVLIARRLLDSMPPTKKDQAYLVHIEDAPDHRAIETRAVGNEIVVGRTSSSGWRVSGEQPKLSARHFVVRHRAGRYFLKDLGSMNGTRVNETTVTAMNCPLGSGDFIHAGGCTFVFVVGEVADTE